MLVTLLGIVTDARLLHPLKELSPIVVTFSGIEMDLKSATFRLLLFLQL